MIISIRTVIALYRIQSKDNLSKILLTKFASTTWPLAKELKDNYPFVEDIVALVQ